MFQIGPSAYQRGARLAGAVLPAEGGPVRVGVLVSSEASHSFVNGFTTAAQQLGAEVVWRDEYGAGSQGFRDPVHALTVNRVELLFWDGDAHEAEALIRELARVHASLEVCGGGGLDPEQHHTNTRVLLEGVKYVAADWQPGEALASRLLGADGAPRPELDLRGYLAGRMIRAALAGGALCPEEVTEFLAAHTASEPYLKAHGFLDVSGDGAILPVYAVRGGKSVAVGP